LPAREAAITDPIAEGGAIVDEAPRFQVAETETALNQGERSSSGPESGGQLGIHFSHFSRLVMT
jgi:hypothetical protein